MKDNRLAAAAHNWRKSKRRYEEDAVFRAKIDALGRGARYQAEEFTYWERPPKEEKRTKARVPLRLRKCYGDIKQRCYNPQSQGWKHYGAKGVRLCEDWLACPSAFFAWSLQNGWAPGLSLDRLRPGDYSPSNCEWVTRAENTRRMNARRGSAEAVAVRRLVRLQKMDKENLTAADYAFLSRNRTHPAVVAWRKTNDL